MLHALANSAADSKRARAPTPARPSARELPLLALLQKSVGNRAAQRLMQRKCECGGKVGSCGPCDENRREPMQRSARDPGLPHAGDVPEIVSSAGVPLPAPARARAERLFGAGFGDVLLHHDETAAAASARVAARAFTIGRDIYFASGRYHPETADGAQLIGHELAHVVQQRNGLSAGDVHGAGDRYEMEADAAGAAFAASTPFVVGLAGGAGNISRKPETTGAPLKGVLWINAFIPRDAENTVTVPGGPHKGKKMLPGPISDCYLTDNRTYDNAPGADSRMHSFLAFTYVPGVPTKGNELSWCDATYGLNCKTGKVNCEEIGTIKPATIFSEVAPEKGSPLRPFVTFAAAASNPCFYGVKPDIDLFGRVLFDMSSREIHYSLTIDQYPAFEMYAKIDQGAGVIELVRQYPPKGKSPGDLWGPANRPFSGTKAW